MHEVDKPATGPYVPAAHITGAVIAVEAHTYPKGHVVHSALDFNPVEAEYVPAAQAFSMLVVEPSGHQ